MSTRRLPLRASTLLRSAFSVAASISIPPRVVDAEPFGLRREPFGVRVGCEQLMRRVDLDPVELELVEAAEDALGHPPDVVGRQTELGRPRQQGGLEGEVQELQLLGVPVSADEPPWLVSVCMSSPMCWRLALFFWGYH